MTHSYSKLLFHLIWSTKNREPFIIADVKHRLYGYIREFINDKKQRLIIINGMPDHVHLLVDLSTSVTLSNFIRDIKVNTSKWMQTDLIGCSTFAWQEGFAAYTVGYSTFQATINYIENQENHHKRVSYEEEYLNLLKIQNISYDNRFVLG